MPHRPTSFLLQESEITTKNHFFALFVSTGLVFFKLAYFLIYISCVGETPAENPGLYSGASPIKANPEKSGDAKPRVLVDRTGQPGYRRVYVTYREQTPAFGAVLRALIFGRR